MIVKLSSPAKSPAVGAVTLTDFAPVFVHLIVYLIVLPASPLFVTKLTVPSVTSLSSTVPSAVVWYSPSVAVVKLPPLTLHSQALHPSSYFQPTN